MDQIEIKSIYFFKNRDQIDQFKPTQTKTKFDRKYIL